MSNYYGTGLGLKLFNNATEKAKAKGSKWMWLCVSDKNYRAQSFYKKLGFSISGSGPTLEVGTDMLSSSILRLEL